MHFQRIGAYEPGLAANHLDLALLREQCEAVGQFGDDPVLPGAQPIAVDLRGSKHDAAGGHVGRLLDHLGGMQQRLGRDAAHVQAHSAERRRAFDEGDFEPEIRRAKGRRVAPRARTEHDQFESARRCRSRRLRHRWLRGRGRWLRGRGRRLRRHGRRLRGRRRGPLGDGDGRDQRALGHLLALLEVDRRDHAAHRRGHVHRRLLALQGDQGFVRADRGAHAREHIDHGHILRIADVRNPDLDHAHSSAFTSLKVLLRNTMKRAASAPSMTRWS